MSRRRLHLPPQLRIVPLETGWLLPGEGGPELFEPASPPADPDRFLDLLDGSNDARSVAEKAALPLPVAESLLRRFAALEGVDSTGPLQPLEAEAPAPAPWPTGTAPPPPILLAGLGTLGLAVLRQLAGLGGARLDLFDPAPVEAVDVGPVYRPGDVGCERVEVVRERTAPTSRAQLRALVPEEPTRASVEAALRRAVAAVGLVVCCVDRPSHLPLLLSDLCAALGVPLVLAELGDEHGLVVPAAAGAGGDARRGCARCLLRYRAAGDVFGAALAGHVERRFPRPARWRPAAPRGADEVLAGFALLAICRALDASRGLDHADARAIEVAWETGRASPVRIPRHPACRLCYPASARGSAELRARALARFEESAGAAPEPAELASLGRRLEPLVAARGALFRPLGRTSPEERERIARFFHERGVDPRTSAVAGAYACALARVATDGRRVLRSVSEGIDLDDPRRAEALAVVEGLERLFTLDLCDPELVVRARPADVRGDALDPSRLPLYAPEQYDDPSFPLRPLGPEEEIDWLWGVRAAQQQPVLVPRDLVFASPRSTLYRPNSNGAACHTSLPHALLNGVYETVERDALMAAWLGRLSLPRLELRPEDPDPGSLRRELEALSFHVSHVDLTTDLEIPVTLAVLRDRRHPDFVLVDVAASLGAKARLGKLHRELIQFVRPYLLDPGHYRTAAAESWEPDAVVDFPDHPGFYQSRAKHRLLAFLDASPTARVLPRSELEQGPLPVREELAHLVERLARRGYEVIAVDCTHRFLREWGLCAVKVLIPGLQPLNAGHRFRVLGGSRVRELPHTLGHAARPLRIDELNPWPHPFW